MNPQQQALLARLASYLEQQDQADTAAPTAGVAEAPDLFTLLSELAALRNEVKIESRQVKAALDQFGELFDLLRDAHRRLQDDLDRQRERAAAERRAAEQELLLELLDLRDRLQAGQDQAARYRPGWLARRGGADRFVAAMADGMSMNLDRLDALLAGRGVTLVEALGQAFDPHSMQAVDTARETDQPDGRVVAVARAGFRRDGRVLRPAEVIVNQLA
jgi:molecular chaperone GrpE